jgi:hypothetical protein
MTRTLIFVLGACFAGTAPAQSRTLADPTRPPLLSGDATTEAAALAGPRLQSVLISQTRRAAVISGKNVALGAKFGDATVESINEGGVVLKYADRKETLYLIPGMDKRERRIGAAVRPGAAVLEKGNTR